jgi:hypothetical protein
MVFQDGRGIISFRDRELIAVLLDGQIWMMIIDAKWDPRASEGQTAHFTCQDTLSTIHKSESTCTVLWNGNDRKETKMSGLRDGCG